MIIVVENKNIGWRTTVFTSVGVGLAVWISLYVAFWMRRSGCHVQFTMDCNDAPLSWLERLVSLWWVRDYQEILAALIALGAAFFVGLPVHRQLHEMRRQSSAAAINSIRTVAYELEEIQEKLQGLGRQISSISSLLKVYDSQGWPNLRDNWITAMERSASALNEFTALMQRSVNRSTTNLLELEQLGIECSSELSEAIHHLIMNTIILQNAPLDEEGTPYPYNPIYFTNSFRKWHDWREWWEQYEHEYNKSTNTVWHRVRSLEDDAMGNQQR
jgi:hypothetical protein